MGYTIIQKASEICHLWFNVAIHFGFNIEPAPNTLILHFIYLQKNDKILVTVMELL